MPFKTQINAIITLKYILFRIATKPNRRTLQYAKVQQFGGLFRVAIYAFFGQNLALGGILPKNSAKTPKNYPFFNGACRQNYKKTDTHYRCLLSIYDFLSNARVNLPQYPHQYTQQFLQAIQVDRARILTAQE